MNRRSALMLGGLGACGASLLAAPPAEARPASVGEGRLRSGDAELFVRAWGVGRPVIFMAGWTLPSDFWAYSMLAAAQAGHQAVAYDRRGHGRSSDPGRGYDHDTLADDLHAVIQTLDGREVVLVGHSMAAMEIARYVSRHSDRRVGKIVLASPITPFLMRSDDNPGGIPRQMLATLREPLSRDFPAWIRSNSDPFFTPETSIDMRSWGEGLMLQTSLYAATELARANAETDFRHDLSRISAPTLVVHGDRDVSAPLAMTGEPTARLIPQASLKVYSGAPHGLPLTHLEQFNADLLAFLG